jgi:hypothetical protein
MSYEPGTLLSIGAGAALEQVVVLSDNRVATKMFSGKPVERRDILSLSDWLLLVEGQNVTVTSKTPQLPPSPASEHVAEHVAEPVPENYAIGTMLRWIKDDNNKRVALVLKDGILQVKELINGTRTLDERRYHGVKRTFFKDVAAWKASLPEGGAITAKANATEYVSSLEDKTKKPMNPHLTNFGYVAELIKRFSIHSSITANDSLSQAIHKNRQSIKDEFSRLSQCISNIDGNVGLVQTYAHQIAMYARMLTGNLQGAYAKTPEEMSRISYTFRNNYKQKLFAYKGGIKFEIGIAGSKEGGLLALAPRPEGTYPWGPVTVIGSTFADLGIEMKSDGKPRLEVSYRRRRFEL